MKRTLLVLALATALLALPAAPALATADRAEYLAQVNPICAVSNAEQKRLFAVFTERIEKLETDDRVVVHRPGKKTKDPFRKLDRLYAKLNQHLYALGVGELGYLSSVAPAPGDEALVGSWLSVRRQEIDLIVVIHRVEKKLDRFYDSFRIESFRDAKRREAKQEKLQRTQDRLFEQYLALYDQDVELGAQLGATYCVTEATGAATAVAAARGAL